ncbi:MAG: hypothetical protein DME12_01705 [Candidatus Rokuibacteriota bacterium]|nr:MAG: hypothetical protein DME12_01705 [Candidatus Rokubacteria bacterium]
MGGRTHHADVRAVGLLRRRDALRVLPAPGEGARSVAPPLAGRPGAGARRRAHPSPPALRATRLDRGRHRGTGRRRARAPLAPVRARDGDARRTRRRGGRNVMVNVLTVVATLSAKPGKGDELAAILREQVAAVRKAEPDCLVYRLHRSKKNPDLFLFYEQYRSDAAFDAHRKAPHLAAFRARRDPLVAGPPEVELYLAVTD